MDYSALRDYRKLRGISIKSVAAEVGLSRDTISDIERGVSNPGVSTLERICSAIGLGLSLTIK